MNISQIPNWIPSIPKPPFPFAIIQPWQRRNLVLNPAASRVPIYQWLVSDFCLPIRHADAEK